jgi:hypothetical protein
MTWQKETEITAGKMTRNGEKLKFPEIWWLGFEKNGGITVKKCTTTARIISVLSRTLCSSRSPGWDFTASAVSDI